MEIPANVKESPFIPEINTGTIWTPLYKSGDIYTIASFNKRITLTNSENDKVVQKTYYINSRFSISGHITVTEISSYRHAKKLEVDKIFKGFYNNAKKQLQQL